VNELMVYIIDLIKGGDQRENSGKQQKQYRYAYRYSWLLLSGDFFELRFNLPMFFISFEYQF